MHRVSLFLSKALLSLRWELVPNVMDPLGQLCPANPNRSCLSPHPR
jgi:hypothetical protein